MIIVKKTFIIITIMKSLISISFGDDLKWIVHFQKG